MSEQQSGIITGGIFLIGIALLGFTRQWWPGILVVIGVTVILRGLLVNDGWPAMSGGLWLIGMAVIFYLRLPWWSWVALAGIAMIAGGLDVFQNGPPWARKRKRKNDEMDAQPDGSPAP